jgi:hypothetical protein
MPSRRRSIPCFAVLLAACAPPASAPDDAPLSPPFAVSDHFSPTGYMGDGTTVGVVDMVAAVCPSRAPSATGDCYRIVYTPPSPPMNQWAGVYWQYPANNWGAYPGHAVEAGAMRARVWARGEHGGETITFKVGGIADSTQPHHDSIQVAAPPITLTTSWQAFEVDFAGASYSEVLGGFAWIVNLPAGAPSTQPIVFYLDGITWGP